MRQEIEYRIALTLIPQIGDVVAKELLQHFGTATDIFKARLHELERIPNVGLLRAGAIRNFRDFGEVEKEILFMQRQCVKPIFYTDEHYPARLRHCYDSPVMMYYKGTADLQASKMLGIVGTRQPTAYGHDICQDMVKALAPHDITIVSGLAYGIDIIAHRTALACGLPTIGVLAHGLDRIYPSSHTSTAHEMLQNGGLLSDFRSGHQPNRQHFPRRNRIVAGLCDAVLVVESGVKGGSLITADIASGYNRDVMAVPGRIGDVSSAGCLELIRQHKAALVTGPDDVLDMLDWRPLAPAGKTSQQTHLFHDLNEEQRSIMQLLAGHGSLHIDDIRYQSGLPAGKLSGILLELEMQALLRALPGNTYQLIHTCS